MFKEIETNELVYSSEPSQAEIALASYPHTVGVRELLGYGEDQNPVPLWGERLALYHPVKSELTQLGSDAWRVYDTLSEKFLTNSQLAEETNLDVDTASSIVEELKSRWIVMPTGEKMSVNIEPDFMSEAEMYLETTEACNLACHGCATGTDLYMSGQAKTMSIETMDLLLNSAVNSVAQKGIKNFNIKWAGGEALMPISLKLIREGQETIKKLRLQYPEVNLTQVVLTNGTHLTEEVIAELKQYDCRVAVSLWGIGEVNDKSRGVRRERDKYEHIVEGLKRLHESGISYNINHVITPGNAEHFADFIRAIWDIQSETFIGREWNWENRKELVPLGIAFFRPQTAEQIEMMNNSGYGQMVDGIRKGFDVIRELIGRDIPIQSLGKVDYLQLFGVIPAPCGSGFNYFGAGPRGVASCHEALFKMPDNMERIRNGESLMDVANSEYSGLTHQLLGPNINFSETDETMRLILGLHGGTGCPRTSRIENAGSLGHSASTATKLYEPIIEELLSLETMRRIKVNQREQIIN